MPVGFFLFPSLFGLCIGIIFIIHPWLAMVVLGLVFIFLYFFTQNLPEKKAYIATLCLCLAIGSMRMNHNTLQSQRRICQLQGTTSIVGLIEDVSHYRSKNKRKIWAYKIKLHAFITSGIWQQNNAAVRVFCCSSSDLVPGDCIIAHIPMIKKMPSQGQMLSMQGLNIGAYIFCKPSQLHKLCTCHTLYTKASYIRTHIVQSLSTRLSPGSMSLFNVLFLGCKSLFDPFMQELFCTWGLSHVLARSGLHLSLLAWLLAQPSRFLIMPYPAQQLIIFLLLGLFMFFTPGTNSIHRSFVMTTIQFLAIIAGRVTSNLHILLFTALIMLFINPAILFALDFQLTFLLTFCVILIF